MNKAAFNCYFILALTGTRKRTKQPLTATSFSQTVAGTSSREVSVGYVPWEHGVAPVVCCRWLISYDNDKTTIEFCQGIGLCSCWAISLHVMHAYRTGFWWFCCHCQLRRPIALRTVEGKEGNRLKPWFHLRRLHQWRIPFSDHIYPSRPDTNSSKQETGIPLFIASSSGVSTCPCYLQTNAAAAHITSEGSLPTNLISKQITEPWG